MTEQTKQKKKHTKLEIWGFIVSIVFGVFSVYTWWDGGVSGATELSVQEEQNRLLNELINETNKTNSTLDSIKALSTEQLNVSGGLTKLSEIVALVSSPVSQEEKARKVEELVSEGRKTIVTLASEAANKAETPVNNKVGKVGWIYLGKFNDDENEWNNKTIEGFKVKNVKENDVLVISREVGFNSYKPKFPTYEKGLSRVFPYILKPGSEVKV